MFRSSRDHNICAMHESHTVHYDCYVLHQYGFVSGIPLTTYVFVEIPDDGPVRNEICSNH
jgi:hypothetical protein